MICFKIKYFLLLLLATVISSLSSFSQPPKAVLKEIKVGDTIPPVILSGLLNHPGKVNIDNYYKKGLLIIDFWATWCIPCIDELGKLDTLSKRFPQNLTILSVAYEKRDVITKFLIRHKGINSSSIEFLTDDNLLSSYFPHKSLPHNIWIDKKGIVRAITSSEDITGNNIKNALSAQNSSLNNKIDDMNFDYLKPYHIADSSFTYRSVFSPFNPQINSGILWDLGLFSNKRNMSRVFAWNASITDLYWLTVFTKFFSTQDEDYSRIIFNVKDSTRFLPERYVHGSKLKERYKPYIKWGNSNLYCYELKLPESVPDTLMESYVLADLNKFFNVSTKIEKRDRLCWIMNCDVKNNLVKSTSLHPEFKISGNTFIAKGMTLDELAIKLCQNYSGTIMPIINYSEVYYPVDIELSLEKDKAVSPEMIFEKLKKYGLSFHKEVKPIDVLVIKEN